MRFKLRAWRRECIRPKPGEENVQVHNGLKPNCTKLAKSQENEMRNESEHTSSKEPKTARVDLFFLYFFFFVSGSSLASIS